MSGISIANPEDAKARLRGLAALQRATVAAPVVAIFDGGQEKFRLEHADRENAVLHRIIKRQAKKITRQRVTIRRAYKLLRKAGFTLKSI